MSQELILDHYDNPVNWGVPENPVRYLKDENPLCGDEVTLSLDAEGKAWHVAKGCCVSHAAVSILVELFNNGGWPLTQEEFLAKLGIPLGYNRRKCALLSFNLLKKLK